MKECVKNQIAKALQISSSTLHDIIRRFRETGEISVRKGQGRRPLLNAFCQGLEPALGPSDETASLIRMILSLTLLNWPRNTSRNLAWCQLKLYHAKRKPYVNMVQNHCHTIIPPPPWATRSTTLTSANRSPTWRHTHCLPSALYSETRDSSV